MRKLNRIYREYLKKIGKLGRELPLGWRGDTGAVEREEVLISGANLLRQRLDRQLQFNNRIIILAIGVLCFLPVLCVYLVFYYRHELQLMGVILASTFTAIFLTVKWFLILWKEKSFMDMSLAIFEQLPPKEAAEKAAEFIPLLYNKTRAPSKESLKRKKPCKKILILASNPKNTPRLRLDEEVREIQEGLRRSKHRKRFRIETRWAVRLQDLGRALSDVESHIVHFAAHGREDSILVEDELGLVARISKEELADLFENYSGHVECIILGACFSAPLAAALSKHIDYVIGMPKEIEDKAAIKFVVGFYDALGAGRSYEEAFKLGRNALQLSFPDTPGHLIPVIKKKDTQDT